MIESPLAAANELKLSAVEYGMVYNAETREHEQREVKRSTHWEGRGSLQPNTPGHPPAVASDHAGLRAVPYAWWARLPFEAMPEFGMVLTDAYGSDYTMVAQPIDAGGAGTDWYLFLGERR